MNFIQNKFHIAYYYNTTLKTDLHSLQVRF